MHSRRQLLVLALTAASVPSWALAQSKARKVRVGLLAVSNERSAAPNVAGFLAGLKERGYVLGENLVFDVRYAEGDRARLFSLADELLALRPDVVAGTEDAIVVMRSKTRAVPLVLLSSIDPVAAGLANSLSQPGGNVTGMADLVENAFQKQFQLLIECVPGLKRITVLNDTSVSYGPLYSKYTRSAAERLGLTHHEIAVSDRQSIEHAFARLKTERADALAVTPTGLTYILRKEIAENALQLRLPTVFSLAAYADAGGLLSYGANFPETFRHAALFVDRILNGAKPASLPIEQVTKLEMVVNLKTAKALGITIPPSVLIRADKLIQ